MPRNWVVASGWPTTTEWEARPARHILEPATPTMGRPARPRAERERDIMKERRRGLPSMTKAMSPRTLRLKPVAVMMMSASSSCPDFSRMPFSYYGFYRG